MNHLLPTNTLPYADTAQPPVLVILGPTASGKSALALAVAKRIGGEIISADSRQVYRELDIGAAKPSHEVLDEVKHHFVNEKNIGEPFTAGDFASDAVKRIQELHRQGKRAVVAGGSTLYLEGLIEGFADLPPANPEIRARLLEELEREGKEKLYARLLARDPEQAATLDPTKSQRLIRSLEIMEITGLSVTELHARGKQQQGGLSFVVAGLSMPREALYRRINRRTDEMVEAGLCGEAERLYNKYQKLLAGGKVSALQSVGYQELFQAFDGKISSHDALLLIKQHTRNYAKRQMTYFSNRLRPNWVDAPCNSRELEVLADRLANMVTGQQVPIRTERP